MIEEFIQNVQHAEIEADTIVAAAKEKVQDIQRNSQSALVSVRASAEASLKQRFHAIDLETDEKAKVVEEEFRRDLQEQLSDLERLAQDHRSAVVDLLLNRLIAP